MKRVFGSVLEYIKRLDKILLLLCIAASVFSVVLLYTLYLNNISDYVQARHYQTQIIATAMGLGAALIIAGIDYKFISKIWFVYAPVCLIFVLLLFTSLGQGVEGADDIGWLKLGPVSFQPSELLKVAFIMTFATHLAKVGKKMNQMPHFILLCIHGLFPTLIIAKQGDDGSALVFLFIFIAMMFAAGLSWKYILAGAASVPLIIYVMWNYVMQPHQKKRFLVLFDPEVQASEMLGIYNQQRLGKIALGSGQLTGKGLLGGSYTYVSEIQTDFIFSYIGMTLGFIGCVATVALLLAICVKILSVASGAKDQLGKLICIGVFTVVAFHSVVNIGMVLCVVPVIGIPLPFISAGGTSVLSLYAMVGLVMSVYAHNTRKYHMFYTEKD